VPISLQTHHVQPKEAIFEEEEEEEEEEEKVRKRKR
jgi:hypothetical protein